MNKENKKIKRLRKIERMLKKKIKIINNNKDFNTNIEEILRDLLYIRTKVVYIILDQLRAKRGWNLIIKKRNNKTGAITVKNLKAHKKMYNFLCFITYIILLPVALLGIIHELMENFLNNVAGKRMNLVDRLFKMIYWNELRVKEQWELKEDKEE